MNTKGQKLKSNLKLYESFEMIEMINKPTRFVTGGGIWLYLVDLTTLSQTHTLNLKNPFYYFPHPCGWGLRGRVSPIIVKPCDSKTKQSKNQMQIQPHHCFTNQSNPNKNLKVR